MRRVFLLLGIVLAINSAFAQQIQKYESDNFNISISGGYMVQDVSWSIAGNINGQNPNIYSELRWINQRGPNGTLLLKYIAFKNVFVSASISQSRINGGYITDTDYENDDWNGQNFHIQLPSSKGKTINGYGVIGYRLWLGTGFSIDAATGYVHNKQDLYINDPNNPELNSKYMNAWKGITLMIDPKYDLSSRSKLYAMLRYSQLKYHAIADWNLVSEFAHPESFRHNANGYAIELGAGIAYKISSRLEVFGQGNIFRWNTGNGTDRSFLSDGGTHSTQFNGSLRKGCTFNIGLALSIQ